MNIYHQIRGFYSRVFNQDHNLKTSHVSLYMFLLNQNNRSNWTEWFKCPLDTAMMGALIGSKTTYYKCLEELKKLGFIEYQKGSNNHKAPRIKIINLEKVEDIVPKPERAISENNTLTVPLPVPLTEKARRNLTEQLTVLLTGNKDILETINIKPVTTNSQRAFAADANKDLDEYKNFFRECILKKGVSLETLFMQNKIDLKHKNRLWLDFLKNSVVNIPLVEDEKHAWNTFKKFVQDNNKNYNGKSEKIIFDE